MKPYFVTMQRRGTLALRPETRRRYRLDEPGMQLAVVERDDGVIELRPTMPVPAEDAWFWTDRWQAMEREAQADIDAGRVTTFATADAFVAHLDELDASEA